MFFKKFNIYSDLNIGFIGKNGIEHFFLFSIIKKKRDVKKILSISFPGYPKKQEQIISSVFKRDADFSEQPEKILSNLTYVNKKLTPNYGLKPSNIFFQNFNYKKSFLFLDKRKYKKIQLVCNRKTLLNPYGLYVFEEYMEKNFLKTKEKRNTDDKLSPKTTPLLIIFFSTKQFILNAFKESRYKSYLGVLFFFLNTFFLNFKNTNLFVIVWNFIIYKSYLRIVKIILIKLSSKNLLNKIEVRRFKNNWLTTKLYEIFIFFNGALRALNMLSV